VLRHPAPRAPYRVPRGVSLGRESPQRVRKIGAGSRRIRSRGGAPVSCSMPFRGRRALWVVPSALAGVILLVGVSSAFCHVGYFPWAGFGVSLDRGQLKVVCYDRSDPHAGDMSTTVQGWSIWRERPPNLDLYAMWPGVTLHTRGPRYAAEIAAWVPAAP